MEMVEKTEVVERSGENLGPEYEVRQVFAVTKYRAMFQASDHLKF